MEVVRADPKKTFKLERKIGKGTYGEVWQARWRSNGQAIAIKIIDDIAEALEEVKETRALNRLCYSHPNLPQFMGVYVNNPVDDLLQPQVWIAMELCGGGTVTELAKRCAKLIPCLTEICPNDLLNKAVPRNSPKHPDLVNQLAVVHCPCLTHRRARNKRRLEQGLKRRGVSTKTSHGLFIPRSTNLGEIALGRLPTPVIKYLLFSTVSALAHLHSFGVIHRDVKGSNILLTDNGEVKLVDFGISCRLKDSLVGRTTIIGTPYWMAPEVIDTEKCDGYDTRADVWSLGVTGLELWEAEPPLAGVPPMKAFSLITHGPHPLSLYASPSSLSEIDENDNSNEVLRTCNDHMPSEMMDFLSKCLDKDHRRRPSSTELLQHRFLACSQMSFAKARNLLLSLMRSLPATGIAARRLSEPPKLKYPLVKQQMEPVSETEANLESRAGDVGTNIAPSTANASMGQRYTSTVSLNISSLSSVVSTPSAVNTDTASTVCARKLSADNPPDTGSTNNTQESLLTNAMDPPTYPYPHQSTLRGSTASTTTSTMAASPLHRSQSAKFCSSAPTSSSAYFSGNSRTEDYERGVGGGKEEIAEPRSDIDMESSGEYEREEEAELPVELEVDGPLQALKQDGCYTDVNGVLVYTPPTSEYRSLFQVDKDELTRLAAKILNKARGEGRDQIVCVVGKSHDPAFSLCQLIFEEIPFLLDTTKELIRTTYLISEKLCGRQELSLQSIEFALSKDFRALGVSTKASFCPYTSFRPLVDSPLLRGFRALFAFSRPTNVCQSKDISEVVQFQLLIMSAGFSPQDIIGMYRILLAVAGMTSLGRSAVKVTKVSPTIGNLRTLPENIYDNIQKNILRGDPLNPALLPFVTPEEVANLLGISARSFTRLIYFPSNHQESISKTVVSRHFWRYLHYRKRRLFSPNTVFSQNDSGFFEDSSVRKLSVQRKRAHHQDTPIRIPGYFFKRHNAGENPLGVYHCRVLKRVVPRRRGRRQPNRDVVNTLSKHLYSLCITLAFDRLNALLHASLNRDSMEPAFKIKICTFHPASRSLFSNAVLDLLHSRFAKTQTEIFAQDTLQRTLDDFFEEQARIILASLSQTCHKKHPMPPRGSGYLSSLTMRDFISQTFPTQQSDSEKFFVMHYHGKETYSLSDLLHSFSPLHQSEQILRLLSCSTFPSVIDSKVRQDVHSSPVSVSWFSFPRLDKEKATRIFSSISGHQRSSARAYFR
uniref:non-specific serine/threonine protein kinase n=1 Tax=Mesocestoides corti TaxID=53468 RepID=A0A5K3F2Y8_MESCO